MQNHFEDSNSKKDLDAGMINYYRQRLQKGSLLQEYEQLLCSQMILDHLKDQGCESSLIEQLEQFLGKSVEGKTRVVDKSTLKDISLSGIVRSQIGGTEDAQVMNALKRYIRKETIEKHTPSERVRKRTLEVSQLTGTRYRKSAPELKMKRLKTCFGHALHPDNQDQEDPYIPVYNIIYDKQYIILKRTGQLLITGDDMGLIKIWSSSNGLLLQSLKGHTMAINSMDVSFCNRYLASCSGDGLVLVWELLTGRPIAALKEANDDPILVLLFCKSELAVASEKGLIYIYPLSEIIKCDGGMLGTQYNTRMKRSAITNQCEILKLPSKTSNKVNGILCMEVNQEGYLAVGTEHGEVVIWDKPENLVSQLKKVEWKEHTSECHLVKWNKRGDKLMTASFDGTAKLWNWKSNSTLSSNTLNKSFVTLRNNKNWKCEVHCLAIAWSAKSTYALASFSKVFKKRVEDFNAKTQLHVYDCVQNKLLHCLDSEGFNQAIKMDTAVYILEAHPVREEMAMTADWNGLILIWNIVVGEIIQVFNEKGYHMKLPNLEVPLMDGCFSPNGLNFVVSTDFGSFSIYGYGVQEQFDQTPVEQFYVSDSVHPIIEDTNGFKIMALDSEMEFCFVDRGAICNFYRMPYSYHLMNNARSIPCLLDEKNKKSVVVHKARLGNFMSNAKMISNDNQKNQEMFLASMFESTAIQQKIIEEMKYQMSLKHQEQLRKHDQYIEDLFREQSVSSKPGKILQKQQVKLAETYKISQFKHEDLEIESNFQFKNSRKRKLIESDNEDDNFQQIHEEKHQEESHSLEEEKVQRRTRHSYIMRDNQDRLANLNNHRISQRRQLVICHRCKTPAEQSIKCITCDFSYHKECAEYRLFENKSCIQCLKKHQKQQVVQSNASRDIYLEDDINHLQIGDEVVFFTRGYELFLQKNIYQIDLDLLSDKVYPSDYLNDNIWEVTLTVSKISYSFPIANGYKKSYTIIELISFHESDFSCVNTYDSDYNFLLLEKLYTHSLRSIKPLLQGNVLLQLDTESGYQHQLVSVSDDNWKGVKCRKVDDGTYQTRKQQSQTYDINLWDIGSVKGSRVTEIPPATLQSALTGFESQCIVREIHQLCKRVPGIDFYFRNPVDLKKYPEYQTYVPLGCDLNLIIKRLENLHYRSKEQILNDTERIKQNAHLFNPSDSEVCIFANQLFDTIKLLVYADYVQETKYEIQTRNKKR